MYGPCLGPLRGIDQGITLPRPVPVLEKVMRVGDHVRSTEKSVLPPSSPISASLHPPPRSTHDPGYSVPSTTSETYVQYLRTHSSAHLAVVAHSHPLPPFHACEYFRGAGARAVDRDGLMQRLLLDANSAHDDGFLTHCWSRFLHCVLVFRICGLSSLSSMEPRLPTVLCSIASTHVGAPGRRSECEGVPPLNASGLHARITTPYP
jgi:hypothetical protein